MSHCQRQTFIDAPVEVVWALISDINRHEEWWPRIVEAECEELEEGCTYREVVRGPFGSDDEMVMRIDELRDCDEFRIRCVNTGTFVRLALTAAQGGTFVEAEMGMDPASMGPRVWDVVAGKHYFRRWLEQSLEAMEETARSRAEANA